MLMRHELPLAELHLLELPTESAISDKPITTLGVGTTVGQSIRTRVRGMRIVSAHGRAALPVRSLGARWTRVDVLLAIQMADTNETPLDS